VDTSIEETDEGGERARLGLIVAELPRGDNLMPALDPRVASSLSVRLVPVGDLGLVPGIASGRRRADP
jgi:hypothetical protein